MTRYGNSEVEYEEYRVGSSEAPTRSKYEVPVSESSKRPLLDVLAQAQMQAAAARATRSAERRAREERRHLVHAADARAARAVRDAIMASGCASNLLACGRSLRCGS